MPHLRRTVEPARHVNADHRLAVARRNLAEARAFEPTTDHERRLKATNIAQIEDYIDTLTATARNSHPAGGGR